MAQNFRRFTSNDVGVSAATLFTANSYDTVVGISVANVTASAVTASVYINDGTNDIYLVKDAPIPSGSALQVLDGGAKVVVQSGDALKVISSAASSLDVWISTVDDISSQDIYMAFIGRKPTNAPLTSDDIPNGIIGAADLATGLSKLTWDTTAKTSGFTAVSNTGYVCNTTSSAFTVTLPASPTAGDTIQLVDYAGTFDTNALTISPNGNKLEGGTSNLGLSGDREGVTLVYIDSTQGWLATSGIQEGTDALSVLPYSVDFLVVAGGGSGGSDNGGGGGAGGYRSSNATYGSSGGGASAESSLTFAVGTVYTITVGAGGSGASGQGNVGVNSSISGTGISTITSTGGGKGGTGAAPHAGTSGGSGAGGSRDGSGNTGGSGTANQGFSGGAGSASSPYASGGGGGAGEAGSTDAIGEGGDGVASTITGSSVTRAGGGGGVTSYVGGAGGGGTGATPVDGVIGGDATVNTGGGGGGGGQAGARGGNGGSGVVILRMPTASYSGTTTGSPTVSTSGSSTILVFNSSGSITG